VATEVLLLVHGLLVAGIPLASKSVVSPTHTSNVPVITGKAFTVTVTLASDEQPFASSPVTVYVVVEVGVTSRVAPVLLSAHVYVVPPVAVKVTVVPEHTSESSADTATVGFANTVNVSVLLQPLLSKYVIVVVPAATPVTTPLLVIVATDALLDAHGVVLLAVPEPASVNVVPTQTSARLLIVGIGFTVTTTSSVFKQPLPSVPVTVYVIVVVGIKDTPLVTPLSQEYEVAPAPLSVTLVPAHTVWSEPALTLGKACTVTV